MLDSCALVGPAELLNAMIIATGVEFDNNSILALPSNQLASGSGFYLKPNRLLYNYCLMCF